MSSKHIRVWVDREVVPGAVPAEISSVFAAFRGGMVEAVNKFKAMAKAEYPCEAVRSAQNVALASIESLEEMVQSLVVAGIADAADAARQQVHRAKLLVDYEQTKSALVYGVYSQDLSGHVWIRKPKEGRCPEIWLCLSDKDCKSLGMEKGYASTGSFEAAYSVAVRDRTKIEEAIGEMMVAWRKDHPAEEVES